MQQHGSKYFFQMTHPRLRGWRQKVKTYFLSEINQVEDQNNGNGVYSTL